MALGQFCLPNELDEPALVFEVVPLALLETLPLPLRRRKHLGFQVEMQTTCPLNLGFFEAEAGQLLNCKSSLSLLDSDKLEDFRWNWNIVPFWDTSPRCCPSLRLREGGLRQSYTHIEMKDSPKYPVFLQKLRLDVAGDVSFAILTITSPAHLKKKDEYGRFLVQALPRDWW
ncbi:hypothetical protein GYMLUDRAFT_243508 [Collybiopsis luxurians FD-317 M1]|uniref:Uncharacterized protein n=1 Tax=Collybiopsis luxurians FD-317 M1 TaxID=944289 RepID=A0A0D0CYA4_9AGAR|nr:hypothetical protein GYMLUDRAFT_243508 [Collybiopsis luxurians FD-317 M1]